MTNRDYREENDAITLHLISYVSKKRDLMSFKNKYWKRGVEEFLSYKGKMYFGQWPTLRETIEITQHRFPNNECFKSIVPTPVSYSYTDVLKRVKEIASYLIEIGVKENDHICVSGKNSPEWAIVYLAIHFSGAVIVPLDYALHPDEMDKILSFGDVSIVFMDDEKIDEIDKENKFIKKRFSLESNDKFPYALSLKGEERELPKKTCDDTAAILFTSGTTGTPKGVMLSSANLMSSCLSCQRLFDVFPTDVFYAILPIHHAYTMTAVFLETISSGACCVFGKRLITPIMLKELKEGKVTMFLAVPMLFNKLLAGILNGVEKQGKLKASIVYFLMGLSGVVKKVFRVNIGKKIFSNMLLKKVSLENMRICICGGGPLPSSTFKRFNQIGLDFVQGYGLTETSPVININPSEAYIESSVGIPIDGVEEKIVLPDSDGNGIIYVRGPEVMQGYYKNKEATDEILDKDGWLNTGDIGHIGKHGYLYLTGRAKSIIVTEGGKNVFPEEIEDKFQLFDEIDQCCIIPYIIDKELKSEGIRIIIHPSENYLSKHTLEEAAKHMEGIVEEVNKELQSYKKITMTSVTDIPLPMTSTKKVKRFEVIRLYQDK